LSVQSPLPVVVVTGLHQAQRRRAVRELLATTSAAVVLHHDLSRAGHGEVVRRIWDNLGTSLEACVPLTNDCPCCALREDLLPELARIAEAGRHRPVTVLSVLRSKGFSQLATRPGLAVRHAGSVTGLPLGSHCNIRPGI
jgi:hypothetical protein